MTIQSLIEKSRELSEKATSRPWIAEKLKYQYGIRTPGNDNRGYVCNRICLTTRRYPYSSPHPKHAMNMEFITHAANSHDAMVDALEVAIKALDQIQSGKRGVGKHRTPGIILAREALTEINKILEKVE